MEIWIAEQWKTIAESCIMGLIFGAGYDIIRVLQVLCGIRSNKAEGVHRTLSPKESAFWLYLSGDLVYMLLLTVVSSIFLGEVNHGILRWYLILPCAAGLWLYHNTVGRLVMAVSETIAGVLRWLIDHILVRPIRWLFHVLLRIGKTIFGGMVTLGKRQLYYIRMRWWMRHFEKLVKL